MATGRDEWASSKQVLKRESKHWFQLVRDSWRDSSQEDSSLSTENIVDVQNAASKMKFQYDALPEEGFIRLLAILPGDDKEVIRLQLYTVAIHESVGRYESLSYVWGDPKQPKKHVIVNDASLEIYKSLYIVLKSLRSKSTAESRVIWADAICINQENMTERSKQVPMMDRIYQNSWRTVVWLGLGTDNCEECFKMLHDLAQDAITLENTSSAGSVDKGTIADDPDSASLPAIIQHFLRREPINSPKRDQYLGRHDIWEIFNCDWWYRAWTLQEILLSSSIILVQGSQEIDWQDFCLAVDHGLRMRIWIFVGRGAFVAEDIIPYLSIKSLRLQLGLQRDPVPNQPDFRAQGVLKLLEMCRQRQARDPRDKIYAIFGMVKAVQSMRPASDTVHSFIMDPDYTRPISYVYRTLTQQLIEITQSLDVLGVCPQSTRGGLPSWVTDWSVTRSFAAPLTRDALDRPRRTHATRGTVGRFRFPLDAVTLVLRGHEVTKVKSVSGVMRRVHFKVGARELDVSEIVEMNEIWLQLKEFYKEQFEKGSDFWHAMIDWVQTLLEWERFAARTSPQNPGGEDAESVYWKTLCAGTYDKDPAETEAKYHEWLEVSGNVRKIEKIFGSISSKISFSAYTMQSKVWSGGFPKFTPYMECAVERRFAWCENEWLCLLPAGTLKDDRIVLAEGGRVPLVLRPNADGYYSYIGEAYVHGIMDGEAFRPELCQDIKVC